MAYCPVYVFRLNGVLYQVCDNIYVTGCPQKVSEHYTIFINPEDPEDFYDPNRKPTSVIVMLILGFAFAVPGMVFMVLLLMRSINNW